MATTNKCAVCSEPAPKRCNDCKAVYYCSREHQIEDWKRHKKACKAAKADQERADSHSLHKAEFDRIRLKYGLDKKADEISGLLTTRGNEGGVSPNDFAERFGTTPEEAVVFLEWIKVGVKFKEDTLDVAKKAGFSGPSAAGKK
mmetsp:Transcript_15324/g.44341  ORF Transcript_15324/g.44341 Transcript_15324/m.44341 type:complete len:144 (-) Transcript_15324:398-829(-)|eukprot:CAMPEP_0181036844 /NCGR_PEP_ID=MMETSP1070-20121207/9085_1 /TAXON_ID=265543 /ORGANISM="Minutocellus polymorphus, Strain NH13" /LENGTH=143 /DNA_ID=CAMNT_0023114521 /DNA_START=54 /DNA_END=485 /DNA_ORIENTATION=+